MDMDHPQSRPGECIVTPTDLRAWLSAMGYSNYRAAKELGVTATTVANMLDGTSKIDRRTALACSAIAGGLVPWESSSRNRLLRVHHAAHSR